MTYRPTRSLRRSTADGLRAPPYVAPVPARDHHRVGLRPQRHLPRGGRDVVHDHEVGLGEALAVGELHAVVGHLDPEPRHLRHARQRLGHVSGAVRVSGGVCLVKVSPSEGKDPSAMQRLLVTGGCGYLGREVVRRAPNRDWTVRATWFK